MPENKEDMVSELCHFFVIDIVRGGLDQMRQGLGTLGILELMKKNPGLIQEAFCAREKPLTASDVNDLFTPNMDDPGSNKYPRQELTLMHWRDYLQDCEGIVDTYLYSYIFQQIVLINSLVLKCLYSYNVAMSSFQHLFKLTTKQVEMNRYRYLKFNIKN